MVVMATPSPPPEPPLSPTDVQTVLIVDDHDLVRLGVRSLLAAHPEFHLIEARTLAQAQDLLTRECVDTVILDLHLPDAHGLTSLSTLRSAHPQVRWIVLSGDDSPLLAQRALEQGAQAFLSKAGDLRCVLDELRRTSPGDAGPSTATPAGRAPASLSPRQLQVLEWVLCGHSNRDIAQRLQLSEGTVKNHISTLLLVYGVRTRAELISALR